MQKFTRALTREVEVAGERLAVTLSEEGLSVRPVGSRRPPHAMSWAAVACALVGKPAAGSPTDAELQEAVKSLKAGAEKSAGKEKKKEEHAGGEAHAAPAEAPAHAERSHAGHSHAEHSSPPPPQQPPPTPPAPAASHTTAPLARLAASPHPPAADQSVPALLERIDRWLAARRRRFHKGLLPGATDAELRPLREALGGQVPAELEALLRWHNGQNPDVVGAFEGSWNLMSAREIADAKEELDANPPDCWQRSWVPFMTDDTAGSYMALDTSKPGLPVRACWQGNSHPDEVAPTLAEWLSDFAAALEAGEYHEDPERGTFHWSK